MVRGGSARSTYVTAAKRSDRTRAKRAIYLRNGSEAKWMGDALRPCETIAVGDSRLRGCPYSGLPGSSAPTTPHPSPAGDTFSSKEKAVGSFSNCRGRRPRRPVVRHNNPSVSLRDPTPLTQGGLLGPRTSWLPCARGAGGVCRLRGCSSGGLPGSSAPTCRDCFSTTLPSRFAIHKMVSHGRSASRNVSFCSLFDPRFRFAPPRTAGAQLRAPYTGRALLPAVRLSVRPIYPCAPL
jgi:hypothetical protein